MARHTPGNYVPLDVNYPRDRAIRRAGPDAELLFVRGLAYAKGARSRGMIPDYDLDVAAIGLKNVTRSIAALVRERLWIEVDGGWFIRSWESWNDADDDRADQQSAGGKRGNHERWHAARSVTDPDCQWCVGSPPCADTDSPTDIGTRSVSDSPSDIAPDSVSESQGKGREGKGRTTDARERADTPPGFAEFWAAYPKKTAKPAAVRAWKAALKRADRATIMAGLARYTPSPGFVANPATWLNNDRWADEQTIAGVTVIATPAGTPGTWTAEQLDQILGPPPPLPQPPRDLDPDAMWQWEQQTRRDLHTERCRAANAKTGRTA